MMEDQEAQDNQALKERKDKLVFKEPREPKEQMELVETLADLDQKETR